MSTTDPEGGKPAEEEPMTEEGKAKSETKKTSDDFNRKSIKVRMIEARNESEGKVDFITAILAIIVGSVVGLIALALVNIVNIAQIVIGSIYIYDCKLSPGIPIVLIINGAIGVLQSFSESINKKLGVNSNQRNGNNESTQVQKTLAIEVNVLRLIAIGSFIAWCVLVYGSDKPHFDDTHSDKYCHSTLYLFAFWLLNVYVILIALAVFCCCCCCCFASKD